MNNITTPLKFFNLACLSSSNSYVLCDGNIMLELHSHRHVIDDELNPKLDEQLNEDQPGGHGHT